MKRHGAKDVIIGQGPLTLEQMVVIARGNARVKLPDRKSAFAKRIARSEALLYAAIRNDVPIYAVNTGYGKSCGKRLTQEQVLDRRKDNLIRFHGCGTGEPISVEATRAAMLCRLLCFSNGYSGVSFGLLEQLTAFLNHGITPVVPCEGSVGASGDLTPMSYVAAALMGERYVYYQGRRMPASEALSLAGILPYSFAPKEAISMINGTSTMTGVAIIAVERAVRILNAGVFATALTVHALKGKVAHFHPTIGKAKPFPGQIHVARHLTELLKTKNNQSDIESQADENLQDPYSIRCAPQIAGVLFDALVWIRKWVETEANGTNDNPIFDPQTEQPLMSGNFYGGHIAFAMDALKAALASIADMSDRQVALMVDPMLNRGLPADLVKGDGDSFIFNHGFKAMSLSTSALAAEALKLTMPAASFSRSTESHNQDKVSMGTIAARDAERICTLTERVLAIHLIAAAQGCDIRGNSRVRPNIVPLIKKIRSISKIVLEDREMDSDIERLAQTIAKSELFGRIKHED